MVTWRLLYVFINRFQYISNLNRKLQHLKLAKQINSLAQMKNGGQLDAQRKEEWQEQTLNLLYYGEAEINLTDLEAKAFDAFESLLKQAKLERRLRIVSILLERIVEYNIAHPRLIKTIENYIIFTCLVEQMSDLCRFQFVCSRSNFFSENFYNALIQKALKILPNTTASDIVQFLKSFEVQQERLEEFLGQNSQLKHHIV